nr:MAG TPA: hypothetical protein [Caudoviricetes sp.]
MIWIELMSADLAERSCNIKIGSIWAIKWPKSSRPLYEDICVALEDAYRSRTVSMRDVLCNLTKVSTGEGHFHIFTWWTLVFLPHPLGALLKSACLRVYLIQFHAVTIIIPGNRLFVVCSPFMGYFVMIV